jgi:hypothetical protein
VKNDNSDNSQDVGFATDNTRVNEKSSKSESSAENTDQQMFTSPQTPKKYQGKKIIATIFGVLLLIVGITAGVILVQKQQDIRERAASGSECDHAPDCILLENPGNSGSFTAPRTISHLFITAKEYHRFDPPGTNNGCYNVSISGNYTEWNRVGSGRDCKDISNIQIWLGTDVSPTPTPTPTIPPENTPTPTPSITPTVPPHISAACTNILAYDNQWNLLSRLALEQLKPGEVVKFTVAGTATQGVFNKARFKINNGSYGETNQKKPGTEEFYIDYTIPEGVTSFSINAQLHHAELGWF